MDTVVNRSSINYLFQTGLEAYRSRSFISAIGALMQVLDMEPLNWRAKLYLGMSYYYMGDLLLAVHHFRFLRNQCDDEEIRAKAIAAIEAINKDCEVAMPNMSVKFHIPQTPPAKERKQTGEESVNDAFELEWIPAQKY